MKRRPSKPFQYSLASIFLLTTCVAIIIRLGPDYWEHIGTVVIQVAVVWVFLSLAVGLIVFPAAILEGLLGMLDKIQDLIDLLRASLKR